MVLPVMMEVVLVLVLPTSAPKNIFLGETGMMGGFIHLMVRIQHPQQSYLVVGIIQMMLQVILHQMLQIVVVKVVWVLVPLNFPPINIIVGLVVVILCRLRLGISQQWFIQTSTSYLIHYLGDGMIFLLLLMMVEVVCQNPSCVRRIIHVISNFNQYV